MPPTTRRSSTRSSRTPSQQQQILNFRTTTKVTKPAVVHPSKLSKAHDAAITVGNPTSTHKPKPPAPEPTLEEDLAAEEQPSEEPSEPLALTPTPSPTTTTELEPESESETKLTTYVPPPVEEKPLSLPSLSPLLQDLPPEITTSFAKLSPNQITLYHKSILSTRLTPPVHQSGLSPTEKILRYFDLSSQYGPSIGITRVNRWKRAYKMGMNPPIEVLKCLVDVEEREGKVERGYKGVGGGGVGGHKRDERTAFVDEELSSRTAQE
ncbi:DNA polymerase delta, subunit 4-domain-containing protein [Tirmania nivea]|nr:DNA polymerase delta, subunit 4-domain-containing protein [Tirmania nivea]